MSNTSIKILGASLYIPTRFFISFLTKPDSKSIDDNEKRKKATDQNQFSNFRVNPYRVAILDDKETKNRYFTTDTDFRPVTSERICSNQRCRMKIKKKRFYKEGYIKKTTVRIIEQIENSIKRKFTKNTFVSKRRPFQVI